MQTATLQLGPKSEPAVGASSPAVTMVGTLDKLPPSLVMLLAILCVQLGSALATVLFSSLGPIGTAWASALFSALVLTAISKPRVLFQQSGTRLRRHAVLILAFGLVDVAMVLPFFLALERIPSASPRPSPS